MYCISFVHLIVIRYSCKYMAWNPWHKARSGTPDHSCLKSFRVRGTMEAFAWAVRPMVRAWSLLSSHSMAGGAWVPCCWEIPISLLLARTPPGRFSSRSTVGVNLSKERPDVFYSCFFFSRLADCIVLYCCGKNETVRIVITTTTGVFLCA